jgi:hypothetical protein
MGPAVRRGISCSYFSLNMSAGIWAAALGKCQRVRLVDGPWLDAMLARADTNGWIRSVHHGRHSDPETVAGSSLRGRGQIRVVRPRRGRAESQFLETARDLQLPAATPVTGGSDLRK